MPCHATTLDYLSCEKYAVGGSKNEWCYQLITNPYIIIITYFGDGNRQQATAINWYGLMNDKISLLTFGVKHLQKWLFLLVFFMASVGNSLQGCCCIMHANLQH